MIVIFVGGIIVIIVPLLALTADQMSQIEESLQDCGSVKAVHLDEFSKEAIDDEVEPRMHDICHNSESALFVLTSPQKLARSPAMLNTLFLCHAKQMLCLIMIDEAHLYAQHGSTFPNDLRVLGRLFFAVLFKHQSLSKW